MSIFSTGLSGLNAAQVAFNSTSNNISNVNTPGYNRELTILSERGVSGGVGVASVDRQFNQFVAQQLNSATSRTEALNTYQQQVDQVDGLLADSESGLAPLMQDFFSSMESLASAPSDAASRQGVMGSMDTLSAQFRSFDSYLEDMQAGINGQIGDEVNQINNASEKLADLNREISLARSREGEAPNSMLNQRDQMVHEMSERLDVKLNIQDGKSYNVTLPGGQPLVSGTRHNDLAVVPSSIDPERMVVGHTDSRGNVSTLDEDTISGGALGGLMEFRAETLDKTQNQVGQLALTFSMAVNTQHAQGVDLNGDDGGAIFKIGDPVAFSAPKNASQATVAFNTGELGPDNLSLENLRATDYDVSFTDGEPTVIRQDTGEAIDIGDGWSAADNELSFGGITMTFDKTPEDGDRFGVQPVRRGAGGMEKAFSDIDKIAAAGGDGGTGNNDNALALQNLQKEMLIEGQTTLGSAYGRMVSDVGNRASIVQTNLAAQEGLTEQLTAVQQSESGVNLDEEAANLIRYQQFYQANAKVIDTGTSILDTILSLRN